MNLVRINIGFSKFWNVAFTWSDERWISFVYSRVCVKCKFGVRCRWTLAARARSRWTNDLRGQHGPWSNTTDLGYRSGNRRDPDKTSLAAALYRLACVRTDVLYKSRSCTVHRRSSYLVTSISSYSTSSARYFRVFQNDKVSATLFTLYFFLTILYFVN